MKPINIDRPFAADDFSFAFQPILDMRTGTAYSHEALVRGLANEPAYEVFNRYALTDSAVFDARCRRRAIEVASRIAVDTNLNLNIIPSAVLNPEAGLASTIDAANEHSFPLHRIIVEVTEVDVISDAGRFASVINEFRRTGFQFAIDDFGSGYAGLSLLSDFQPDFVKLDMGLVRNIESDGPRQAIVRAIWQVCIDLGIELVVEGVETISEFAWFTDLGVTFYQGYLFARPMFEAMPEFAIPPLPQVAVRARSHIMAPGHRPAFWVDSDNADAALFSTGRTVSHSQVHIARPWIRSTPFR